MRWRDSKQSDNIEDRRGQEPAQAGMGVLVGAAFFAVQHFTGGSLSGSQSPSKASSHVANDENKQFVAAVLGTTETVWKNHLGNRYQEPTLVLYNKVTRTGCGVGQAQTGPFYCPADQKIYLDLSFMKELKQLGAPGDFAFAYVIAHEVGHHVQNLLGTSTKVHQLQQRSSKVEANKLSVMLELQADCYAGVWGHDVNKQMNMLEPGDIEEGIKAADAVELNVLHGLKKALNQATLGFVIPLAQYNSTYHC